MVRADVVAGAMRKIPAILLAAALTANTVSAQQIGLPNRSPIGVCATARTAAVRLICADPDLSARDLRLAAAYRQKRSRAPLAAQKELLNEQLIWMRQRDENCGLIGKDAAPLDELRKAKECMQNEIEARLAALQSTPAASAPSSIPPANAPGQIVNAPAAAPSVAAPSVGVVATTSGLGPTSSLNSVVINRDILLTPLPAVVSAGTAKIEANHKAFHFVAPASGVSGTAECGAMAPSYATKLATNADVGIRAIIEISLADDANSYPIFEDNTWPALLDKIRQAVRDKCDVAGPNTTHDGLVTASQFQELYEVKSSRGLFVARSAGPHGTWSVDTNLPQTRKKLQSDLGIQKWIKPSELTRNPYFFKDMVVGMVVQLDHKISDKEAVFARSGARIFVSGVPHSFADQQIVILAGRVVGNKGVVDPSGSEELMPAIDYLGTADCAKACEALSSLVAQ